MDISVHAAQEALGWIEELSRVGYRGVLNFTLHSHGEWPWRIHIRSFIASPTTGVFFRGDGRGPSLDIGENVTSRVRSTFIVDPMEGMITDPQSRSDFTLFYGTPPVPGQPYVPPQVDEGIPKSRISDKVFSGGTASFDFQHYGKDPLTPGFITPSLDVHSTLSVTEDQEKGMLIIKGSFTGDSFPSAEAFVADQSGMTKVFLGAKQESGGIHSLFGDNKNPLFNVDMQIMFDSNGNFTSVRQGDQTYTIDEWNKYIQDEF
ncbi:hypothetical protein [Sinomicrobium sp. M5D2P17]